MAKLSQCLGLDLSDSLARYPEIATNLLERPKTTVIQSIAKDDYPALSLGQLVERIADLRSQQLLGCKLERRRHRLILDEVSEKGIALASHRRLE